MISRLTIRGIAWRNSFFTLTIDFVKGKKQQSGPPINRRTGNRRLRRFSNMSANPKRIRASLLKGEMDPCTCLVPGCDVIAISTCEHVVSANSHEPTVVLIFNHPLRVSAQWARHRQLEKRWRDPTCKDDRDKVFPSSLNALAETTIWSEPPTNRFS